MIVSTHAGTYFKHSWCVFDLPKIKTELHEIQKKSEDPDLWNDRENAQRVMKSLADLREEVEIWDRLQQNIQDALELAEFEDPALRADLEKIIDEIESELSRRELSVMLSGPYDKGNAILTICVIAWAFCAVFLAVAIVIAPRDIAALRAEMSRRAAALGAPAGR